MVKAFILIRCKTGSVQSVMSKINDTTEIEEYSVVTGEYDIIAKIQVEEAKNILETVAGKIHDIGGVSDTTTCIAT